MFRRLFKNVLWQGKLLFSFLILCQMVNLAPFWSTLTIKNKSVIHTQLASQWNHFPDHEISVQSDKKIRLVSKSRLWGSLEKRIRSALNPILPGLGSSCWPLLVLLNAKIRFCCTEPSAARICKSLWVAVLSEFNAKMWVAVCWGRETPNESKAWLHYGLTTGICRTVNIDWPRFLQQGQVSRQDKVMGKHCLCLRAKEPFKAPDRQCTETHTTLRH